MKKIFYCLPVVLIAILSACGGSSLTDPQSAVDQAIKMANDSIPIEESPILGTIPSAKAQSFLATDNLRNLYSDAIKEITKNISSESDYKKAEGNLTKLNDAKKEALTLIENHYNQLLDEAANKINGKAIPCQFDPELFSAAEAKFVVDKSDSGKASYRIQATLTPTKADRWVQWDYLGADGKVISAGAGTVKDVVAGKPFNIDLIPRWDKTEDFSKLNFRK